MSHVLSFRFDRRRDGATEVTPCVDGEPLSALVTAFERARGYDDPAGGYGGLVPEYFRYGPMAAYFRGRGGGQGESDDDREIYVLGCECGEVGCWPLMASVAEDAEGYVWSGFNQPHRRQRDYAGFGPFRFERGKYEQAVDQLARRLQSPG